MKVLAPVPEPFFTIFGNKCQKLLFWNLSHYFRVIWESVGNYSSTFFQARAQPRPQVPLGPKPVAGYFVGLRARPHIFAFSKTPDAKPRS